MSTISTEQRDSLLATVQKRTARHDKQISAARASLQACAIDGAVSTLRMWADRIEDHHHAMSFLHRVHSRLTHEGLGSWCRFSCWLAHEGLVAASAATRSEVDYFVDEAIYADSLEALG